MTLSIALGEENKYSSLKKLDIESYLSSFFLIFFFPHLNHRLIHGLSSIYRTRMAQGVGVGPENRLSLLPWRTGVWGSLPSEVSKSRALSERVHFLLSVPGALWAQSDCGGWALEAPNSALVWLPVPGRAEKMARSLILRVILLSSWWENVSII